MANLYKCDFCGKLFEKCNCHIKRSKHNFCSPECYHYFYTKRYEVSDKTFERYYKKYFKLILKIVNMYDNKYFDELMQIGRITLWSVIGKNDEKRLNLLNLNAYLKNAIIRQIKNFFRIEKRNQLLLFSELENLEQFEPQYHEKIEDKIYYGNILCNVLENLKNRKTDISTKILIEREIFNNSVDFIAKKYSLSKRQVASNNYAIKNRLRRQFPNLRKE